MSSFDHEQSEEQRKLGEEAERQRVCPSCRMTISIFATKCRYCGEEVGKPKEETRALTMEDLGGETIYHRAPSGSVMEALEAFRLEENIERAPQEAAPKGKASFFKKSNSDIEVTTKAPDLPELDEHSRAMADAVGLAPTKGSAFSRPSAASRRPTTLRDRLVPAGGIALALVVLLVGGIKGVGWYKNYREARDTPPRPEYVNHAPAMLERNEPPLAILEEAAKALGIEDTSENRKYVELAMERVVTEYERLVHPEKFDPRAIWSMDDLNKASLLASRASSIHANEKTAEMSSEVELELRYYRMTLLATRTDAAQFAINLPFQKTEWIERDKPIADRFIVRTIQGNIVKVEDTKRPTASGTGRVLTYQVGSSRPM